MTDHNDDNDQEHRPPDDSRLGDIIADGGQDSDDGSDEAGADDAGGAETTSDRGVTVAEHDPDDEDTEASDEDTGDKGETDSARTRHWLTNDIIAAVMVVGYFGVLVYAGRPNVDASIIEGHSGLGLHLLVGVAVLWAFGDETVRALVRAVREVRG